MVFATYEDIIEWKNLVAFGPGDVSRETSG
jgi:hypothetical protein